MRVLLIHPPQATFFSPYLALPSLAAVLRAAGHEVELLDLNLSLNHHMLSPAYLERLGGADAREIGARAEAARQALSSPDTYVDEASILAAYARLDDAYARIGRAHGASRLGADLSMRHRALARAELEAAADDASENPYAALFDEQIVPAIARQAPELIGVGVAFEAQLIPTVTLTRRLARALPEVPVVLGGNVVTKLRRRLLALDWLPPGVDYAITHEGETPLLALVDALGGGAELASVPNLIWSRGGRLVRNEARSQEDLSVLPTPDFDGLPLDDYLLPLRLLPLLTSRGCYWGRCAFCTHQHGYGGFRMRPRERLLEDLTALTRGFGARALNLTDEAVPPRQVRVLAQAARAGVRDLAWFGDVRVERVMARPDFIADLRASGCRLLAFGIESGSPRVLAHMCKGASPEQAARALRATHEAGIFNVAMTFTGFPTETAQEAQETVAFVRANRAFIDGWGNGPFSLQGDSGVQCAPARFGITELQRPPDLDLAEHYDYRVARGLTATSAARASQAIARQRAEDPRYADPLPREVCVARRVLAERAGDAPSSRPL
jgi:anaerobic magnesium-protoporphyrin IX monomethyl ester cyclase